MRLLCENSIILLERKKIMLKQNKAPIAVGIKISKKESSGIVAKAMEAANKNLT